MLAHTSSCNTVTAQLKSDDLDGRNLFPCLRRRRRRRCRHRVCDFGRVPTPALLPPLATHFLDRPRSQFSRKNAIVRNCGSSRPDVYPEATGKLKNKQQVSDHG
uniref:Uncharacterized protein n=1 Tax=Oryza nivara TaxID=4536 RepID=A0A0E0II60_ORYNI